MTKRNIKKLGGKKMPYIKRGKRPLYKAEIESLVTKLETQPVMEQDGDLNYIITSILKLFYKHDTLTIIGL